MQGNAVYQLLGLARRAQQFTTGYDAVTRAVRRRQVHLVLIAANASAGTQRRLTATCEGYGVPWMIWGDKETLGRAIGRSAHAVVAVLDAGFAAAIAKHR